MSQEKELRNLYIKGHIVGGKSFKIQLQEPVGDRAPDGTYTKVAEKGAIVEASLVKGNDQKVVYKTIINGAEYTLPLSQGKVR